MIISLTVNLLYLFYIKYYNEYDFYELWQKKYILENPLKVYILSLNEFTM